MSAEYLKIPINPTADSGTMEFVIPQRAITILVSGTNSSLGNAATATNAASGTGYPTPPGGGVATVPGGSQPGSGSGMFVTFTQSGGQVDLNSVVVVAAGAGYAVGDTGTITTGDGAATYLIATINNSAFPAQVNDSSASFTTTVAVNDIIYNGTTAVGVVQQVNSNTLLTCTTALFPAGGESYNIRKNNLLNSNGATFTTRGVKVGDIVANVAAGSGTTVAALIDENSLTLASDIFGIAGGFDDDFTISPPATEVFDFGQNFLTSVSVGDVVENTVSGVTETVTAVENDNRLQTTGSIFVAGNAFTIKQNPQTSDSSKLVKISDIVFVDAADQYNTDLYLNIMGQTNNKITINHSDQGSGARLVASAIESTLVRGAVGVDLPEPPGPKVALLQMPIFEGAQIVVDTVVLS
tara:strand:- start:20601 stop:21833 length:1233 start_codon:yes stop_codon:yes gene_type:complete